MADPNGLYKIKLFRIGNSNNFQSVPVIAIDDSSFMIISERGKIILRDEDLKPNEEGKYIIDLAPLDLKFFYPNIDLPTSFEMPVEILEERARKRKENAIRRDAIFEQDYKEKRLFYYIEGEKLIIKLFDIDEEGKLIPEVRRETTADKIEIIHNRKAVNVKKLKLGHPYLELPGEVVQAFEKVLRTAELRTLTLKPAGISMLNGKKYYKLSLENIPVGMWNEVKSYFEDFGQEGTMTGFLTCEPGKVAEILKISIE
jgi:hypothetical protein